MEVNKEVFPGKHIQSVPSAFTPSWPAEGHGAGPVGSNNTGLPAPAGARSVPGCARSPVLGSFHLTLLPASRTARPVTSPLFSDRDPESPGDVSRVLGPADGRRPPSVGGEAERGPGPHSLFVRSPFWQGLSSPFPGNHCPRCGRRARETRAEAGLAMGAGGGGSRRWLVPPCVIPSRWQK